MKNLIFNIFLNVNIKKILNKYGLELISFPNYKYFRDSKKFLQQTIYRLISIFKVFSKNESLLVFHTFAS